MSEEAWALLAAQDAFETETVEVNSTHTDSSVDAHQLVKILASKATLLQRSSSVRKLTLNRSHTLAARCGA